jgi:hypothetical protein
LSSGIAAPHPPGHEEQKYEVIEADRLISDSSGIFSESPESSNGLVKSRKMSSKEASPIRPKECQERVREYVNCKACGAYISEVSILFLNTLQ